MVKAYLKYVYADQLGVITSNTSNCQVLKNRKPLKKLITYYLYLAKCIVTAANEYLYLINIKTGAVIKKYSKADKHVSITQVA